MNDTSRELSSCSSMVRIQSIPSITNYALFLLFNGYCRQIFEPYSNMPINMPLFDNKKIAKTKNWCFFDSVAQKLLKYAAKAKTTLKPSPQGFPARRPVRIKRSLLCQHTRIKLCVNKTKYTMDPRMPYYACHKHHLHWFVAHYLTKASCENSASSL